MCTEHIFIKILCLLERGSKLCLFWKTLWTVWKAFPIVSGANVLLECYLQNHNAKIQLISILWADKVSGSAALFVACVNNLLQGRHFKAYKHFQHVRLAISSLI